jgi:hypothetical protein
MPETYLGGGLSFFTVVRDGDIEWACIGDDRVEVYEHLAAHYS